MVGIYANRGPQRTRRLEGKVSLSKVSRRVPYGPMLGVNRRCLLLRPDRDLMIIVRNLVGHVAFIGISPRGMDYPLMSTQQIAPGE
jgi:hypothetical protein